MQDALELVKMDSTSTQVHPVVMINFYLPRSGQVYEPLPLPLLGHLVAEALALTYDLTDAIQSC